MKKLAIVFMTVFCLSVAFPIMSQDPGNEFFIPGGGGGGDKCVKQC